MMSHRNADETVMIKLGDLVSLQKILWAFAIVVLLLGATAWTARANDKVNEKQQGQIDALIVQGENLKKDSQYLKDGQEEIKKEIAEGNKTNQQILLALERMKMQLNQSQDSK